MASGLQTLHEYRGRLEWRWDNAPRSSGLVLGVAPDEFGDPAPTLVAHELDMQTWERLEFNALREEARRSQRYRAHV